MAFFDNWRVQLASINALNNETERRLQALENEYPFANAARQESIFEEYTSSVNRSQAMLVSNDTPGTFFSFLWAKSCELYPELADIKDNDTRHAILACPTKEAQDKVLHDYLARTVSPASMTNRMI